MPDALPDACATFLVDALKPFGAIPTRRTRVMPLLVCFRTRNGEANPR
jgi:hypothetical protein